MTLYDVASNICQAMSSTALCNLVSTDKRHPMMWRAVSVRPYPVVGFTNSSASSAFIRDMYLRDYLPCQVDFSTSPPRVAGACADSVWAGAGWNESLSATESDAGRHPL
jgi:hypothetical protein